MIFKQNIVVFGAFLILLGFAFLTFLAIVHGKPPQGLRGMFGRFMLLSLSFVSLTTIGLDIVGSTWQAKVELRPIAEQFAKPPASKAEHRNILSQREVLDDVKKFDLNFSNESVEGTGLGGVFIPWMFDGFNTIVRGVYVHPRILLTCMILWFSSTMFLFLGNHYGGGGKKAAH